MNIDKIRELIQIDLAKINPNENNVKHQIVIPFMDLFQMGNHKFEHVPQGSRIRIDIKSNRIIIETKALNENLDNHIQQLKNYSDIEESTVLSLLTNGKQWRIYSPHWRRKSTFKDRLIYKFEIKDLEDDILLQRLEKILDFSNYESEEYFEHIEQRENEIIRIEKELEEIRKEKNEQLKKIETEKYELEEQAKQINEQIESKRKEISDIKNEDKIPEIKDKIKEYYLPVNKSMQPIVQHTQPPNREPKVSNDVGERLKLCVPKTGVDAHGQKFPNGTFEVFVGSKINKNYDTEWFRKETKLFSRREQLEKEGKIVDNTFTETVPFASSAQAANFITCTSVNARQSWQPDK